MLIWLSLPVQSIV